MNLSKNPVNVKSDQKLCAFGQRRSTLKSALSIFFNDPYFCCKSFTISDSVSLSLRGNEARKFSHLFKV